MTTDSPISACGDVDLVGRCLSGDTQAYRGIVERYQSLVCAVTYAGCGDVHTSEDLAQETFLQAWRNLRGLKDPNRLRAWLCGIARHLVANARRKEIRIPVSQSPDADQAPPALLPTPAEHLITQEEHALLWQTLSRLPETYREPLVLYYRQEESVAAVAAALEISQETARQRLARGRAMLAERLERLIGEGLRNTSPTPAFALAVLAAMPGMTVSATAGSLAAAAKGAASAKTTVSLGMLASSLLGPLLGIASGYLGYRVGLAQTISATERRFMRRFFYGVLLLALAFNVVFAGLIWLTYWIALRPDWQAATLVGISLLFVGSMVLLCLRFTRAFRALRAHALAELPDMQEKARAVAAQWNIEYRSRLTLLGLPLIHINIGGTPDARPAVAKGWIAIGAKAYGMLFAFGGLAIGGISIGGFSIGLLAWGGFAVGALVWGGLAAGLWALGGVALGYKVVGGCALAWAAAQGGVAVARQWAQGAVALARHANDTTAATLSAHDPFFRFCQDLLTHTTWIWAVAFLPILVIFAVHVLRKRRSHRNATGSM